MAYTQYDEEQYILEACGVDVDRPSGRVLDIGACHPAVFSNSRELIDRGWEAVLVEAAPRQLCDLVEFYGSHERVKVVSAAVGLESTLTTMHITNDIVSTVNAAHKESLPGAGWLGEMRVVQVTLELLAMWFGGFDFISIDAEGLSADLCLHMLELRWRPRCFVVEHDSRMNEICIAAAKAKYRMVYANGTNGVFAL